MPGDADVQLSQVLDRAPDFGASGPQFLGDAGAADDKRCIVAQQANDAAETSIG
jgi:hypothetical protein